MITDTLLKNVAIKSNQSTSISLLTGGLITGGKMYLKTSNGVLGTGGSFSITVIVFFLSFDGDA